MELAFTPVFIGGSGRSGTTILLNLLSRHPDFHGSMPREIKYLTSRYGLIDIALNRPLAIEENVRGIRNNLAARILPSVGVRNLNRFEERIHGSWWSEIGKKGNQRGLIQGISRDQLDYELERFNRSFRKNRIAAARGLFESLSLAQMQTGAKRYFGDSTPVNIMQSDLIFRLLPESKFISVVRDGRDVSASVVRENWGPDEHFAALDWWANRIKTGRKAFQKIPEKNRLEIRIENLVIHHREETFAKLLDFLDLPSHSSVDDYFDQEVLPERLNAGRWRDEPIDTAEFEVKYNAILENLSSQGIVIDKI